jgi:hypothetical protein
LAKAAKKDKPKLPPLERRVDFATKHCSTPDGQRFSLKGREWVRDNYWKALEGFKLWPVDMDHICDECMPRANTIVDDFDAADETRTSQHALECGGCLGLVANKLMVVVLLAPRQEGKTLNTAAWAQSAICTGDRESIAFVASSEGQSDRLFDKNYVRPIRASPAMNHACTIVGNTITVPGTNSDFEYLSTSMSGVGDTRTRLIIDECREVPPDVAVAMLPTLVARGGRECKFGHIKTHAGVDDKTVPARCTVCNTKLQVWYGTAVLMSSAGILKDTDADWFAELVEHLSSHPHPNYHLIILDGKGNPKVAQQFVSAITDVFGKMASTKAYAGVETGIVSRRKGEDFISKPELDAVIDPRLEQHEGGASPCVAFLDTSRTGELTSLVIVAEDPDIERIEPWDRLVVQRVDVWDPKQIAGGVIDVNAIEEHLDYYVPKFPLAALKIDTRGSTWAAKFVRHVRLNKPWGRIVSGVDWRGAERFVAWQMLEQYILAAKIRIPTHKTLLAELRGARRIVNVNNVVEVRESSRRKRHLDVAESLASCLYMIHGLVNAPASVSFSDANRSGRASSNIVSALRRGPLTRGLSRDGF